MYTAIDIETTGFTVQDTVTVIGFGRPVGTTKRKREYHVAYDGSNGAVDSRSFEWGPGTPKIVFHEFDDEAALLSNLGDVVGELSVDEGTMLVGWNAETYGGGFDFPFLRSRCIVHDVAWPFAGINYLDLQDVLQTSFNTKTVEAGGFNKKPLKEFDYAIGAPVDDDMYKSELVDAVEEHGYDAAQLREFAQSQGKDLPTSSLGTLDGAYELLIGDETDDPFDGDSAQAPAAFADGEIDKVVKHNLSDLKKTLELVELVQGYVHDDGLTATRI